MEVVQAGAMDGASFSAYVQARPGSLYIIVLSIYLSISLGAEPPGRSPKGGSLESLRILGAFRVFVLAEGFNICTCSVCTWVGPFRA